MFDALPGRVTVFAGLGKGAGKTTAVSAARAALCRLSSPVGLFTIGFDKGQAMRVSPGDVVITSVPLARAAEARLEIIESMPGRSAIGQLCLARAVRAGAVSIAGPEHLSQLAWAIELALKDGLVTSVLVDGAVGRMTQAGALPRAQFVYCATADAANYTRVAAQVEMVSALADLPLDMETGASMDADRDRSVSFHSARSPKSAYILRVDGPLTESVLDSIPKETTHISMETFCDCFLSTAAFNRASQRYHLMVRKRVPLLGFAVALKNVKKRDFLDAAPSVSSSVVFNPMGTQIS